MLKGIKGSWFSLLMLVLGIGFIVGYFALWQGQAASCTEPVTAVIVSSEEMTFSGEDGIEYEYRIVAEYEVDGETYSYYDTIKSRQDEGDSYKLVYNPEDPTEAMTPGRAKMMWLVPVVGGAMVLYALWSTGLFNRRSARKQED